MLTIISREAAPGFPRDVFDRAYIEMAVKPVKTAEPQRAGDVRAEITGAALAVVYRHRRGWEAGEELLALARQQRSDRGTDWHYAAQTALFEFVVSLHSAFESSFYGLYFAGAQLRPGGFPHVADDDSRRKVTPKSVVTEYEKQWPASGLTAELVKVKDSPFYDKLSRTRNVLAHRIAPGFEHRITLEGDSVETATEYEYELVWRGEKVEALVPDILAGTEALLGDLWTQAAKFFVAASV
ncbi:hypothetical protein M8Z33_07515 [Streptomyces sp. ZAF1911]|uniref:hypothetical protein n=1 Tax=Streptomyces sp. ZAF1911 TaxID=2944129 RepID=UPI00237BAE13|nr:hypothetical protein [Streptomyces sp. ZAF1911]MDD9376522.1 hypothetical protein [Streptomyces sp. ZAF1911]